MKITDIVLIDPPDDYEAKTKSGCLPQIGLLSIAAVLEKAGYRVRYIDAKALGLDIEGCCNEVVRFNPRYVGITSVTSTISIAASVSQAIKTKLNVPIVLGGPHVTACPEITMNKYRSFDVAVIGEGEVTIVELLKAMENDTSIGRVDGVAFREGSDVLLSKRRQLIEDLDCLPFPAWHLLPNLKKHYRPSFTSTKRLPSNHIITGRGCHGKCIFCDKNVSGDIIRKHSTEYVIGMIEIMHNTYGIKDIQIEDDVFIDLKQRALEICDKLIERKIDLTWSCMARVNNLDLSLLKKMKEAGCWRISYGIESGSQEILDFIRKGITVKQVENAVKLTKQAGIKVNGFFILGHPTETKDSIMQTMELMLKLDLDSVSLHHFVPYRGSWAFKFANKYGTFRDDWEKSLENLPDFFPNHL